MNLLIVFSSVAEHSGLHDNIFDTVIEARSRGYNVYVAYRSSEFSEKLKSVGVKVIETDCKLRGQSCNLIKEITQSEIDLIHTHPGDGRKVALMLSRELKIPLVMTLHGKWTNNISSYISDLDAVFTVSEGIRQKVIEECSGAYDKVFVIPNYSSFILAENKINDKISTISIISRLDKDKQLVIDIIERFILSLNNYKNKVTVNIIGDGTEIEKLKVYIEKTLKNDKISIIFRGWVDNKILLEKYYMESDLIIGPGRVAIDAYSINKPVIVVGSKKYEGFISRENWTNLISGNFGGYRHNDVFYEPDITKDIHLMADYEYRRQTAAVGYKIVNEFFNKDKINNKLFTIYSLVSK